MIQNAEKLFRTVMSQRVIKRRGEIECHHGCGEHADPNCIPCRAVTDSGDNQDRCCRNRQTQTDSMTETVGNFFSEAGLVFAVGVCLGHYGCIVHDSFPLVPRNFRDYAFDTPTDGLKSFLEIMLLAGDYCAP